MSHRVGYECDNKRRVSGEDDGEGEKGGGINRITMAFR